MNDVVTVVIKDIPRVTRDRFKAACSLKSSSMKDELIRLMNMSSETITVRRKKGDGIAIIEQ